MGTLCFSVVNGIRIRGPLLVLLGFESGLFLCLASCLFVLSLIFFAQCFGFELVPVAFELCQPRLLSVPFPSLACNER